MIAQIDIDNFALFKKARLTFEAGLNVLTGESGSGKSLALEAVVTLFGSRLSPERIGGWGDQFHLRGVVRLGATDPRWAPLTALGIEPDEVLIVERLSGRDGRSLYRAQGELIPAQAIRALGDSLIQYVGQHQLLRAASPQYVLDWVDQYGRLGELRSACGAAYRDFRSAEAAVSALESLARDLPQLDEKRQLREELASYQFQEDEDEAIQKDMTRLRAGRKLMETSRDLYQLLEGTGPQAGLLADVAEARRLADTLASYDATVENMARSVAEVEQILGDVRLEVSRWMDGLDLDPARLEQLEARADLISRMKRRYGPELRDVLEFVESLGQEIARLDNLDWEMRQLVRKRDEAQSQLLDAAETLSRARQDILGRAAEELTERIREMEMPTGELVMRRSPAPVTTRGVDLVEIYFSASQGQALKPLAKVASGGELARVALALAVTGQGDDVMVHLFDEVDQGLGGASAERVGRLLAELGRGAQVLAVSHQPVVAARADHHLRVSKSVVGSRSESTAAPVSDSGRVREIARMLSGSQDDIAMEHAESLLKDKPGAAG